MDTARLGMNNSFLKSAVGVRLFGGRAEYAICI